MVEGDFRSRVRSLVERFAAQGMSLEHWLSATGQPPEGFLEAVRTESRKAVRVDLALRAVARLEGIEADDDDVDAELSRIALRVNQKIDKIRKLYDRNDAIEDLRAQIRKSKALDWLIEHASLVGPDGSSIDASLLLAEDTGKDEM
jgi:trigger factor